ncbi:MAG: S8 family serine peptidase [Acidobacteriota bacterium]
MTRFLSAFAACLLLATLSSSAQTGQSVPILENESTGAWFVELSSPPAAEGTAVAALEGEEAGFHTAAASAGIRYSEGRHFRRLWNGLTVTASADDVRKLRALPGVQSVYPVLKVALQQVEEQPGAVADMVTAIRMTGADIAQSSLGLIGRHVTVAVMDTGIDYQHPDLGGCFGPNCRVAGGFDLVGDDYNAGSADPAKRVPHPDPDPDDCNGHGTHVSGIIGANGVVKGVAPGVTFRAYRVFGCQGSTTADIMLAAMEMVLDDGADVLNMSIGSALTWPQYPTAKGANQLVKQGVVVVASIGNEGALGLYGAAAPGIGKDVIGVASFDNTHMNVVSFAISPDGTVIGYIAATGAPAAPLTGAFPMARTGTATSASDACNIGTPPVSPLAPGSLTGRVALIRRGTCSFYEKAFNAQAAGAAGVVFYNNAAGLIPIGLTGTPPITIPVVTISDVKGALIDARLASGPVTMTWTSAIASEPQPTGGLISSFSSYGLAADLSFKPDLGAPGGSIRSTLPIELGGYGNLSGTSMASPHVAGAVALLLEARPGTRPREVQQRLQNTARPAAWWGIPALGLLDNVHRQGAGLLRIDDAVKAHATILPSSLALGEIETGAITRSLRISLAAEKRRGPGQDDPPVTYTLGHQPAVATGADTFAPAFVAGFATATFSARSVTLGGKPGHDDDEATVDVTFTAPPDSVSRLFGGYITLTPNDGGIVLRVPYGGYNGNYQAITALTPTPAGFPWLARLVGTSLFNQPGGAAFTLAGGDLPYILVHLDHQVRTLKMEVINVVTGEPVGFADISQFLSRNSSPTSFFALTWDGTAMKRAGGRLKPVPNGSYRIEMSALKALGDRDNPKDVERWTSPTIVISRP